MLRCNRNGSPDPVDEGNRQDEMPRGIKGRDSKGRAAGVPVRVPRPQPGAFPFPWNPAR